MMLYGAAMAQQNITGHRLAADRSVSSIERI
jgi:hypothetical protein